MIDEIEKQFDLLKRKNHLPSDLIYRMEDILRLLRDFLHAQQS